VDKRDDDPTTVTWEEVFLDLTTAYDVIFADTRSRSFGGDPTGPAARTARFPMGVGLQGMGFQAIEMGAPDGGGEWETEYGLAVYEATFGKQATVLDYTQLVEQRRPLPGSIRIPSFIAKKDGQSDFKKKGSIDASSKDKHPGPDRMFMSKWQCGQMADGKMFVYWNFYFATGNRSNSAVADKCRKCSQLKKEAIKSGYNKQSVDEPSFGAVGIERLIKDRVAIGHGLQKAIDAQKTSDESVMAGFAQADYSGNAFSLGLGGIVAESISSLHDDEPCFPEDRDAVVDQFGNNADAYLR